MTNTLPENNDGVGFDLNEALTVGGKTESKEKDQFFDEFFSDDEEENFRNKKIAANPIQYKLKTQYEEIDAKLEANLKKLRKENPTGGLRAFRFVTAEVLLEAPEDYFFRYETDVREVTQAVQGLLSDRELSGLIGEAVNNPTNDEVQDRAFRSVQALAVEVLDTYMYKGIEKSVIVYMVCMDIIGYSRLDPLWRNRKIDEILCNGPSDIQAEVGGKLHKIKACRFRDAEHLESVLERIFGSINKVLSRTTPLLNGRMYDNSRIFAVHRSNAPMGPNVAIRRHPDKHWTPMELIKYGSGSEEMFTDIGNWVYKGCSYMVIGGTSSGKTSLLNALSGFWDPKQRILSMEDDLELKLNPHKLLAAPMECRPANPNKEGDQGVTMRDLVKAALRMRPDGIIIGEIRDGAMYDLCQALNTGHWGCSTVHANSPREGIYRMQSLLTQAELISETGAFPLIAAAFDFVVMQEHFPQDGSRKITSVCEVDLYPSRGSDGQVTLGVKPLWKFQSDDENNPKKVTGKWVKVADLSQERQERRHLQLTKTLTWPELEKLATI